MHRDRVNSDRLKTTIGLDMSLRKLIEDRDLTLKRYREYIRMVDRKRKHYTDEELDNYIKQYGLEDLDSGNQLNMSVEGKEAEPLHRNSRKLSSTSIGKLAAPHAPIQLGSNTILKSIQEHEVS